uniref:Uncharacterized protein n=1 Tax=Arundo donax TaxID=35708 RepID=A0A0A9GMM3_ARUDO
MPSESVTYLFYVKSLIRPTYLSTCEQNKTCLIVLCKIMILSKTAINLTFEFI